MFDAVLQTKLYRPVPRPNWVKRPRLLQRLKPYPDTKLILVSAPAGYGKTALVSAWVASLAEQPNTEIRWLSLNEDDSDPQQFFQYLTTAAHDLPGLQSTTQSLLQANPPLPAKQLAKAFARDLSTVSGGVFLILDDVHALNSAEVDEALMTLIDLMPPTTVLVLVSRTDPGFPISRLRAQGALIELKADDLRFSAEESGRFFGDTMGLTLTQSQLSALDHRTEGWVAGLQMAAVSMRNRDPAGLEKFIQNFAGSHRFILDYLMEEVLAEQPEEIQAFLGATAILDRLSGPLCDAVTGRQDSQRILETLERNHLFVLPLDDQRGWFRYHHLFADVLKAQQVGRDKADHAQLHRRAAEWYAAQGGLQDAIQHALQGEAYELAAGWLEQLRPSMEVGYPSATWLNWAKQIPEAMVEPRPVLSVDLGWALLDTGDLDASEARFTQAERWLEVDHIDGVDRLISDQQQFDELPASIAAARAYRAMASGDIEETRRFAQIAIDILPPDVEHQWRRAALALLGLIAWTAGDLETADRAFLDFTERNLKAGADRHILDATSTAYVLSVIRTHRGRLIEAEAIVQKVIAVALESSNPPPMGTSDLYRELADLARLHGEFEAAESHLATAEALGTVTSLTDWPRRIAVSQALLKQAQGDIDAAHQLFEQALAVGIQTPLPETRPASTWQARLWAMEGNLEKALGWVHQTGLSDEDPLSYFQELNHITLARILLLEGSSSALERCERLLGRLRAAAEAGGRNFSLIEILILQVRLFTEIKVRDRAWEALSLALRLAYPQGIALPFIEELDQLVFLLKTLEPSPVGPELMAIPGMTGFVQALRERSSIPAEQDLVDPLSERELEILRLVAAGLKNKEIAEQLYISVNTVLFHTKNLYGKLGVNKRTLAIAKARELSLID